MTTMSPMETMYKGSLPSKFNNWQRLFTRSTIMDLATGRMIGSSKQYAGLYYMSFFQTKPTHLKYRPTLIYSTSALDILLWHVYNLHLHYYLSIKTSFPFIIIVMFVPKLNRQGYSFLLSTIKSHSPFNLLRSGIWGPHKTSTR